MIVEGEKNFGGNKFLWEQFVQGILRNYFILSLKDFYEIFHHLSKILEGGARRGVLTADIDVNESRDRRPTTL